MVIDKAGYNHLIEYFTENLALFEKPGEPIANGKTVMCAIEDKIAANIINLCTQHDELEMNHRSLIIREVDGIVYDLQEILSSVINQPVTQEQLEFIEEFSGLVKNLFDSAIADLLD
ncbi:DUF3802 family protein [Flocculibacter collagenilyticus]|uniref:DUF3802 family protein n=1 Tax=Flocculibacter collagenilyticus TaxID=2744479 RepID=UPI0018F62F5D|nr:DUF3802 family protein [Flocculibacter collagenilyticus]